MKCCNCKFLSELKDFNTGGRYEVVRCTLGLWDKEGIEQWYSWGNSLLNRGPVRRHGESCTRGEPNETRNG